jgi:dihydrolipoamide dehydrogenase
MKASFDVIVIGAGPGGYVAAIRAAQLGLKTAVVEREHLGGICLNWGCIPTKALLKAAEVYHLTKKAENFGIKFEGVSFDFSKVIERSREISKKLASGIKHLLKKNNVTVIEGNATLKPNKIISIKKADQSSEEYQAKNIIIATGARARIIKGIEPDGESIWSYKEAMLPKALPKSILVMGSGAIGVEFASFYNTFGSKVTIIEMMDRILPNEDAEISAIANRSFRKQGMDIITNAKVIEVKKQGKILKVTYEEGGKQKHIEVEKLISAVGVVANVENIGLEATKVKLERGFIKTDKYMMTDEPGIYAIGDVTSPPWLAHKASHEGIIAAEKIAGLTPHAINANNIPGCTYCYPQIASIGLTEAAAKAAGIEIKVGRFPFHANGKAIALDETDGLVKLIFCAKTGEMLGSHMIGAEVTEMIQGLSVLKTMEGTELDLFHTIFPHPTISEAIHEAGLDAYNRAVHI